MAGSRADLRRRQRRGRGRLRGLTSITISLLALASLGPWPALACVIFLVAFDQIEGNLLGPFVFRPYGEGDGIGTADAARAVVALSTKPVDVLVRAMLRKPPTDPLARRDPEAIAAFIELFGPVYDAWFAPEVSGAENAPAGPCLIVASHNGGIMTPDMWLLMLSGWRRFGPVTPSYGLAHDQVMHLPIIARLIGLLGGVPARQENASTLLERGAQVLVYPGGDIDTFKPWSERHTVKFGGRTGFVRLALRRQVPIVPVVSVGAHETFRVLTDGHRLAHALHLKELLRLEVLPVFLCLPWGLWIGPYEMHLPLPSKIRLRVLPPIHFDLPPSAADDDDTVHALAEQVRSTMQAGLDELARAHDYGVGARLGEAARAAWSARRGHADREVGGPAPATH